MPANEYPREDFTRAQVVGLLKLARDVPCPRTNPNCRCQECLGARQATLRVSTFVPLTPEVLEDPCDGTMTCMHSGCVAERALRVRQGVRSIVQPWVPTKRAA